jgi:hypothetical protein
MGAFFLLAGLTAWAGPASNEIFSARAQQAYLATRENYLSTTNRSSEAAWKFGRACFNLAERATNDTQRADIARTGITACLAAVARDTNSAPAHFYLAANLGELAQAQAPSLAAYRLVHEVEHEFLTAAELDVRFNYADPARTLGELYFKAPGWPLSIGSNRKAREWLGVAVKLEPNYPGNQLNLAEAQLKWREREALEATLKKINQLWPAARTNFTGEAWEESWVRWNTRRAVLENDYRQIYGQKP